MKREILYLVVEKAIVDNNIDTEDEVAVVSELEGPFKDDSGYHFVISRGGHVICDRQLQRPADAVNYYNAEGIVVGYVLTQDETRDGCTAENQCGTGGVAAHGAEGAQQGVPQSHREGDAEQRTGAGREIVVCRSACI